MRVGAMPCTLLLFPAAASFVPCRVLSSILSAAGRCNYRRVVNKCAHVLLFIGHCALRLRVPRSHTHTESGVRGWSPSGRTEHQAEGRPQHYQ